MTEPEAWMLLKDGATKVAQQRLSDLHQLITTTVSQFHDDAITQIEGLEAPSHEGLGAELFKALTDVLMVAFPEEKVIEKAAVEAIKGFRDVLIAGVNQAEKEATAQTLPHARDQLRHILDDLVAATRDSTTAAWHDAAGKVDASLTAFFDAHPEHKHASFGADAQQWEEWLCDSIGIQDAAIADPSAQILGALWTAFHNDFFRISAQLNWHDMDVGDRLEFLVDMAADQRLPYLHTMGVRDTEGWLGAVAKWVGGEQVDALVAAALANE